MNQLKSIGVKALHTFWQAFVAALIVAYGAGGIPDVQSITDINTAKKFGIALGLALIAAGLSALKTTVAGLLSSSTNRKAMATAADAEIKRLEPAADTPAVEAEVAKVVDVAADESVTEVKATDAPNASMVEAPVQGAAVEAEPIVFTPVAAEAVPTEGAI